MEVIYVSGKFTDDTRWKIEQNVKRIHQVGFGLMKIGYAVIFPVWFGDFMTTKEILKIRETRLSGKKSSPLENRIIRADCELVRRSDIICMVSGWETSRGANTELGAAKRTKKRIFLEVGNEIHERLSRTKTKFLFKLGGNDNG